MLSVLLILFKRYFTEHIVQICDRAVKIEQSISKVREIIECFEDFRREICREKFIITSVSGIKWSVRRYEGKKAVILQQISI